MNYKKMSKAELINELESLKSRLEAAGVSGKSKDITERKKTEDELEQKKYYLEKAQEIANIGTWELDMNKNKLVWTDENYRIFGIPAGTKLTYEIFLDYVHPDDRDYVDREWKAALNNKPYDIEHRIIVGGKVKWVREKADLKFDEEGNCVSGIGFTQDITERKKAEEEIKRLAKFPSENPNPVMRVFNDGNILYHNKASTFLLDTWGCRTTKILPDNYIKIVSDVLHSGLSSVTETECSRGRIISLTFAPVVEEGYVNIYGMDITDRKKAEENIKTINESLEQRVVERTEKLKESEERYRKLMESAQDAILCDINGTITDWNKSAEELFGYSKDEIMGKSVSILVPEKYKKEHQKGLERFLKTGESRMIGKTMEVSVITKEGAEIPIEISLTAQKIEEEKYSFMAIARDITERRRAEEALRRSEERLQEQKKALEQKNIALSEILGQIEIEKKQIKDNVITNAENLLLPVIQKLKLTGESRKYVQLLQKNLEELTSSFGTRLTEKRIKLTSREIEICDMIKNGLTNKEIASLLNISHATIERHRANIRKKLGIIKKDINLSSFLKTL